MISLIVIMVVKDAPRARLAERRSSCTSHLTRQGVFLQVHPRRTLSTPFCKVQPRKGAPKRALRLFVFIEKTLRYGDNYYLIQVVGYN